LKHKHNIEREAKKHNDLPVIGTVETEDTTYNSASAGSILTPGIVTAALHLLPPEAQARRPNKQWSSSLCNFVKCGQLFERLRIADIHLNGSVKWKLAKG